MEVIGGISGGLALIILVILLVLYRNWKYEQELDSLLWKIDYKDIETREETCSNTGKLTMVIIKYKT